MVRRVFAFAACAFFISACSQHVPTSPIPATEQVPRNAGAQLTTASASSFKTYYVNGEGATGFGGTEIVVFDQSTQSIVKRIAVPSPLHVTAFATDAPHHRLYATAFDPGFVADAALLVLDTASDAIISTVPMTGQKIPTTAFAIDHSAQYGYTVTNIGEWTKGVLARFDLPLHRLIGTIPVGDQPSHIVADPIRPYMYVFWGSAQVTYIAAFNTTTLRIDKLSPITGISGVYDVVMSHNGARMYLIAAPLYPRFNVRSPVFVVDVSTLKVIAQTTVVGGASRITITPDDARVFVNSDFLEQVNGVPYYSVSYVSAATNSYVSRFSAEGLGFTSLAVSHDGKSLFLSSCIPTPIQEESIIDVVSTSTFVTTKKVLSTDNCLQSSGQFSE